MINSIGEKKMFSVLVKVISAGLVLFSVSSAFADPYDGLPSEIEMMEYLEKDSTAVSGLKCGLYDDDGNIVSKKVFYPEKHSINLDGFSFLIHTSKSSPEKKLSNERREYLRELLISFDENRLHNFDNIGIVSESASSIGFNWIKGSTLYTMLRDMYLLKKELEENASDLVILTNDAACEFEEDEPVGPTGTVSIGD